MYISQEAYEKIIGEAFVVRAYDQQTDELQAKSAKRGDLYDRLSRKSEADAEKHSYAVNIMIELFGLDAFDFWTYIEDHPDSFTPHGLKGISLCQFCKMFKKKSAA